MPSSKISKLKPKRYHGYAALLFIFGTLFPPLAVAARFGIGSDFWLNLLLTICGYIPGHAHNFYIQNIRNNKNRRRTPKWAIRYGLINDAEIQRKDKKSQWANRYNERLPRSTLETAPYEEDQSGGSEPTVQEEPNSQSNGEQLWNANEESYYGNRSQTSIRSAESSASGRWHYPANFEDADAPVSPVQKKKKKKDRWALSEDARRGVVEDDGLRRKKKKKISKRSDETEYERRQSDDSVIEPEDPTGRTHGPSARARADDSPAQQRDEDLFNHQF